MGESAGGAHLVGSLVAIKAILAFLNRSTLGLDSHIGLDTDIAVDLGLDFEVPGFGEVA